MPKYRLMASVSWVANSKTDFGVGEFDTLDEACEAAFEAACEYLDAFAVEVADDEDD